MRGTRPGIFHPIDEVRERHMLQMSLDSYGAVFALVAVRNEKGLSVRTEAGLVGAGERVRGPVDKALLESDGLLVVPDTSMDERFRFTSVATEHPAIGALMAMPIYSGDRRQVGALVKGWTDPRKFSAFEQGQIQLGAMSLDAQFADIADARRGFDVQRALVPHTDSPLAGYEVDACNLPAKRVASGFYDWRADNTSYLRLSLAESTGIGVDAGLMAAALRAALRASFVPSGEVRPDVSAAVMRASRSVDGDLRSSGTRVRLVDASVEGATGLVEYVVAGMAPPVVIRAGEQRSEVCGDATQLGVPSAGRGELPSTELGTAGVASWPTGSFTLEAGDMFVIANEAGRTLLATLIWDGSSPAALIDRVESHVAREHVADDVIVLAFRRTV